MARRPVDRSNRIPPHPRGAPTYAQGLGARPATPEEKRDAVAKGWLKSPTTRAYTLPNGRVVSNRAMQQAASEQRYGERLSLEQRASLLKDAGFRSGASVKSHWVHAVQRNQPWARKMTYRELERNERFKNIWEHWEYLRNKRGGDRDAGGTPRPNWWWADHRFRFLRRYGVLHFENGYWVS